MRRGEKTATSTSQIYIQRRGFEGAVAYSQNTTALPSHANKKTAASSVVLSVPDQTPSQSPMFGARGQAFATSEVNPNIEFEVPYYGEQRFTPGKPLNYTQTQRVSNVVDYQWFDHGSQETMLDMFCAAGEDFQVYFYTGPPRLYYYAGAPV